MTSGGIIYFYNNDGVIPSRKDFVATIRNYSQKSILEKNETR